MKQFWFDHDLEPTRRGALRHSSSPDGVWALLTYEWAHPADSAKESAELLGLYGAAVHGLGHMLLDEHVQLPNEELADWAVAPDRPSAELGSWDPTLLSIDGNIYLAVTRAFGSQQAFATSLDRVHLIGILPAGSAISLTTIPRSDPRD